MNTLTNYLNTQAEVSTAWFPTPVPYRIYGMRGTANVLIKHDSEGFIYTCMLQFGGEVDIRKVNNEWVELSNGATSPLAKSLGASIELTK